MPLGWNEESKGDDKRKGKKSGKRINRYVELDCNIEDTGIYSYTCVFPIERNKYSKIVRKKRKKRSIYIFDGSMAQLGTGYPTRIGSQREEKFEGIKRNAAKTHLDHDG